MQRADVVLPALRQLSESLWVLEDTCNVYLVRRGDAGLAIDSGSGAIAEVIGEIGVSSLEWVLHTHHHRDQCWGTSKLVEDGVRVAVPEHERYLFESAQEHWQTKRIFDNYSDGSHFFSPGADIEVDTALEDYETFTWRGIDFLVLPAQGHTFGSSALLASIDGRLVAFTGDLITAGGLVYQLHALEYDYGDMAGVSLTLQSLQALRRREPELVLPSHGPPIEEVRADIDRLEHRLMDIVELGSGIGVSGFLASDVSPARFLPEAELIQLSEHLLWSGPWTCSNFYVLLSGDREALLIDYGHGLWTNLHIGPDRQSHETTRFVAHHLEELESRFGATNIEVVAVTHVHDDHICGIPYLQRHHETECWALDAVAKVLERPSEWASTPCTLAKPIRVHRTTVDKESVHWRGFDLQFHWAPGQTEFHSVISAEIDGRVVAFTGDNLFLHEVEVGGKTVQRPHQSTVFRNSFQLEMHRRCVEVMRAINPELICPGHEDVLPCDPGFLAEYANFVALKERAFRTVVAEPADHYIDLFWARLRPYLATVEAGASVEYKLDLRNNLERPATYAARLLPPPGWLAAGEFEALELGPGEAGELSFGLTAPDEAAAARVLVTAEILIDGVSQGPVAEALVTRTA